jgi:hypothetical protein
MPYSPLLYSRTKRARSSTTLLTLQGMRFFYMPPLPKRSVTYVPGPFCYLCARSVPNRSPGVGAGAHRGNLRFSLSELICGRFSLTPTTGRPSRYFHDNRTNLFSWRAF